MLILTANDVRQALPMVETISAMKRAYASFSSGMAEVPQRGHIPIPPHDGTSLLMPAFLQDESGEALAVKIVSVFPHNTNLDLPLIHAAVLVLEADTGRVLALLEGGALTAIRTGAASGAATDLLAREDSQIAAIFGAGVQGRTQLEAVCTVRSIHTVWVYDPQENRIAEFIEAMSGRSPIPRDIRPAKSTKQAVTQADIVCCATTSPTPVFMDQDLKPGVHINGVGSFTPDMQEIPLKTVQRALVIVDSHQAAMSEAGDILQAIQEGLFSKEDIYAELGEILAGDKPGRTDPSQVTFFKSVGIAVQDAAAAQLALHNAQKMGLGQEVAL